MSWLAPSVRGSGRGKVGLACAKVLSLHLLGNEQNFVLNDKEEKRLSM